MGRRFHDLADTIETSPDTPNPSTVIPLITTANIPSRPDDLAASTNDGPLQSVVGQDTADITVAPTNGRPAHQSGLADGDVTPGATEVDAVTPIASDWAAQDKRRVKMLVAVAAVLVLLGGGAAWAALGNRSENDRRIVTIAAPRTTIATSTTAQPVRASTTSRTIPPPVTTPLRSAPPTQTHTAPAYVPSPEIAPPTTEPVVAPDPSGLQDLVTAFANVVSGGDNSLNVTVIDPFGTQSIDPTDQSSSISSYFGPVDSSDVATVTFRAASDMVSQPQCTGFSTDGAAATYPGDNVCFEIGFVFNAHHSDFGDDNELDTLVKLSMRWEPDHGQWMLWDVSEVSDPGDVNPVF